MSDLARVLVTVLILSFVAGLLMMLFHAVTGFRWFSDRSDRLITVMYCGPWAIAVVAFTYFIISQVWVMWP